MAIAVVALFAWLLEFATHSHNSDPVSQTSTQSIHCHVCAGFQAGAGPMPSLPTLEWVAPSFEPIALPEFPPSATTVSPYRSRAPPRA
ncbi:hypothetical protein ACFPN2_03405 [Steroidobacter flavus]|uniref:DUF2946 domain-containing protein n=1 Tax=Steroidobacter flavus TaxID=1842136 RepID=A0ABV8SKH3_9GAMM